MEPEAPTRQTVQDQGDDLEFNYVADELCIVLSRAALPDSSLHEGDAEVPARALYDAVLDEMNRQLGGLLSQPASVKPSDGAGSSHLLRRLSAEPRLLAPLDRLPQPGFRAGADPSSAVVLPRRGNTRTALCFYSLPLGRSSPDRTGPPAPRQWSGPELAESVGVLVSGINRNRWQLRPVNVNGEAWHIRAATPNWLTATQGDHTGGGPGSRPTPVTRSQLQRQEGAASTAADERRWRFWFADKTLQSMVEHQHATAAAIEEPAGRQGEAPARTPGRVIVAVLDTSPEKSTVDSAAARYPDNWLLQDVSRNVIFDGDLVPAAGQPGQSPYAHLRYYVPNWRGGLGFWRRAYGGTETTRAHLDRRRHEHYAMPDHGLFVAGIIRDIAPTAEVHLIRVLDDAGVGDLATLTNTLRALPERLLSGANSGARLVVNLSLMVDVPQKDRLLRLRPGPAGWGAGAGPPRRHRWLGDFIDAYDDLHASLREAIAALDARDDVLVVAAAGNDALAEGPPPAPRLPAGYGATLESVLTVASIRSDGTPSDFSNRGNESRTGNGVATFGGEAHLVATPDTPPEIPQLPVAAGRMDAPIGVFSAATLPLKGQENETGWVYWAGTSFSTPIVSALAADLWSEDSSLSPATVIARIQSGATEPEVELVCRSITVEQR